MCDFRIMVKKTSNKWSAVSEARILEPSLRQGVSRNPVVLTLLCGSFEVTHHVQGG